MRTEICQRIVRREDPSVKVGVELSRKRLADQLGVDARPWCQLWASRPDVVGGGRWCRDNDGRTRRHDRSRSACGTSEYRRCRRAGLLRRAAHRRPPRAVTVSFRPKSNPDTRTGCGRKSSGLVAWRDVGLRRLATSVAQAGPASSLSVGALRGASRNPVCEGERKPRFVAPSGALGPPTHVTNCLRCGRRATAASARRSRALLALGVY